MNKRGGGIPMAERVRLGTAVAAPEAPPADEGPAKHCWVADAIDRHGVKRPGLLVEWRQAAVGWEGRVLYAAMLRPGEWAVVEEWLPAELLTPR
ncbi:hypothetical protein GCM10027026_09460 [Myroides odoratimimus subsp. xuanwuensis]